MCGHWFPQLPVGKTGEIPTDLASFLARKKKEKDMKDMGKVNPSDMWGMINIYNLYIDLLYPGIYFRIILQCS